MYSDSENETPLLTLNSLSGHTPSRRLPPKPHYQPEFPFYPVDWSFHNRSAAMPDFSHAPCYDSPHSSFTGLGDQVKGLVESQKTMMKVQQDMVKMIRMVKDISNRVGDLEGESQNQVPKKIRNCHL
jgi:hypothetical protein